MELGGEHHIPADLHPRKEPWYPLYRWLAGPQGRPRLLWWKENLFPPTGFEPRTVQAVASRYIDYGKPVLHFVISNVK
jgi:hypothetical protein